MNTKTETFADVNELSMAALTERSHMIMWGDSTERWQSWEVETCSECGAALVLDAGGEREHRHVDTASSCAGHVNADGPMMNFYYPLPNGVRMLRALGGEAAARLGTDDPAAVAAHILADLPLAVVKFQDAAQDDDAYALALTGGGMDLSWEICEGYMRLGYLPPVDFRPPHMSGRGSSPRDRWILDGCRRARVAMVEVSQRQREMFDREFPPTPPAMPPKRGRKK